MFLHSFVIKYVIYCNCRFWLHFWKNPTRNESWETLGREGYIWCILQISEKNSEIWRIWRSLRNGTALWRNRPSNAPFEGCVPWIATQPWCGWRLDLKCGLNTVHDHWLPFSCDLFPFSDDLLCKQPMARYPAWPQIKQWGQLMVPFVIQSWHLSFLSTDNGCGWLN